MVKSRTTAVRRVTLAEQVAGSLRERLHLGEWDVGARLPTEMALCEEYSTSRSTIRSALSELEGVGLVVTRHGSGTYATAATGSIRADLRRLESINDTVRGTGHEATVTYHSIAVEPATDDDRAVLELEEGAEVVVTERTIHADGVDVAFSRERIPATLVGRDIIGTNTTGSFFHLLDLEGISVESAITEIHAASASDVGPHAPAELLVHLHQVHYLADQQPVIVADTYFAEGRFQFSLVRTR